MDKGIIFGENEKSTSNYEEMMHEKKFEIVGKIHEEIGGLRSLNDMVYKIISDLMFKTQEERFARMESTLNELKRLNADESSKIELISIHVKELWGLIR